MESYVLGRLRAIVIDAMKVIPWIFNIMCIGFVSYVIIGAYGATYLLADVDIPARIMLATWALSGLWITSLYGLAIYYGKQVWKTRERRPRSLSYMYLIFLVLVTLIAVPVFYFKEKELLEE